MAWDTGSEPRISSASAEYETRNPEYSFSAPNAGELAAFPFSLYPLPPTTTTTTTTTNALFLDLQKGAHCCLVVGRALAER